MKMQGAIRERKNQRNRLPVGVAVMMVSALDLVKMLETIRHFWDNLGWEIIYLTPLFLRAFEIEIYMLLVMSGIWLAKACWKARAVEGFKHIGSLLLFGASSATAISMIAKLPATMKINVLMLMVLSAIAIVCVEAVAMGWTNLPRQPRSAAPIELSSQG